MDRIDFKGHLALVISLPSLQVWPKCTIMWRNPFRRLCNKNTKKQASRANWYLPDCYYVVGVLFIYFFVGGGSDAGWKRKSVGEIYCREKRRRSGGREQRKFWIYDSVSEVWPQGGIYNWDGEEKSGGVQLQVTDCHLDLHSVQVRPAHGEWGLTFFSNCPAVWRGQYSAQLVWFVLLWDFQDSPKPKHFNF